MAKRYQAPRDFTRSFKKPKLDVSLNKGRPVQKAASADIPRPSSSPRDDFWDDGDDDVLLLATQVAETAVNQRRAECNFVITESELTFSEFIPNAGSSTQRPLPEINVPNQDILSQIFEDDFEWGVESAAKKVESKQGKNSVNPNPSANTSMENGLFKKPSIPVLNNKTNGPSIEESKKSRDTSNLKAKSQSNPSNNNNNNNNCNNVLNNSQVFGLNTEPETEVLSQSAARRQLASERQIKFLMDRLDTMKKENQKLSFELEDNKSKITSKEGEISLLRDELKHTKQQMQNLKMERILIADAAKTECKTKIAELSSQVEAKKTEAQMKALECVKLRMRHAEESQRLEMSMRNESMFIEEVALPPNTPDVADKCDETVEREILRIRCGKQLQPKGDSLFQMISDSSFSNKRHNSFLYNETNEEIGFKGISDQVIANQWKTLRIAAVNLQVASQKQCLNDLETEDYSKNICSAFTWLLHELNNLAENLNVKNCRVYSYHGYDLRNDFSERHRESLLQPSALYPSESAIELRRCIAAIALLTRCHTFIAKQMFQKISEPCMVEGEYFLLAAAKCIRRIGFCDEILEHFGIIEAFASLLQSLLIQTACAENNKQPFPEEWKSQMVTLLKDIIFTRPTPWVIKQISSCLLLCTRIPFCLSLLCENSRNSSFRAEAVRSICEFNKDSCILQVYASLLEICFPLHNPIRCKQFELLTVITLNHIRFVYFCFTKPPRFIHDRLPSYNEDEDDDLMENEPSENLTCNENTANIYSTSSTTSTVNNSSNNSNNITQYHNPPQLQKSLSCECYHKLSLSIVTLGYQVLRQWLLLKQNSNTRRVSQISKILVQLLYIIFCDNYLTSLFRDSEDTKKHYLFLICKWISENTTTFDFKPFHLNFLEKLQNSHVMPKTLKEEENLTNLASDLNDWCRITNDKVQRNPPNTKRNTLKVLADPETFFEGLKGYAYNFQ